MRLSTKLAAALTPLLCLSASGCSPTRDAASNAPALASPAPSPQNEKIELKALDPLPPPTDFVNDYANVFDAGSKARLESALRELNDKAGVEFVVVTVETTGGQTISLYSPDVPKGRSFGPREIARGGALTLLVATMDGTWRLQVSQRIHSEMPNEELKRLGEQSGELYARGKYAEGITKYAGALVAKLEEARGFKLDNRPDVK